MTWKGDRPLTTSRRQRRPYYLKFLLVVMTSFLMLIGVCLFASIGLIKLRYSNHGASLLDLGAIIMASFLCITSLLGYKAVSQVSAAMLKCFIIAIVTIIIIIIIIDILAFTHPETIRELLTKLWTNLNDHGRIGFQKIFACCDVTKDHSTSNYHSSYDVSCYLYNADSRDGDRVLSDGLRRRQDCVKGFISFLHTYMSLISAIMGAFVMYNAIMILLSAMIVVDTREYVYDNDSTKYASFPVMTDVILWRRRTNNWRSTQVMESGNSELPPAYPTGPVLQTYRNSIDRSLACR